MTSPTAPLSPAPPSPLPPPRLSRRESAAPAPDRKLELVRNRSKSHICPAKGTSGLVVVGRSRSLARNFCRGGSQGGEWRDGDWALALTESVGADGGLWAGIGVGLSGQGRGEFALRGSGGPTACRRAQNRVGRSVSREGMVGFWFNLSSLARWTEEAEAESRGAGHPASDPHVHPPAPRPGRVPHAAGNACADAKGSPHAHADAQRCPYAHTDAVRAPNPHADAQAALSRPNAPRNAHPNAADATGWGMMGAIPRMAGGGGYGPVGGVMNVPQGCNHHYHQQHGPAQHCTPTSHACCDNHHRFPVNMPSNMNNMGPNMAMGPGIRPGIGPGFGEMPQQPQPPPPNMMGPGSHMMPGMRGVAPHPPGFMNANMMCRMPGPGMMPPRVLPPGNMANPQGGTERPSAPATFWEEGEKRRKTGGRAKKRFKGVLERASPCPNVDVRNIHGEHPRPNMSGQGGPGPPHSGPSFMDDPSGYLAQQTALLNNTMAGGGMGHHDNTLCPSHTFNTHKCNRSPHTNPNLATNQYLNSNKSTDLIQGGLSEKPTCCSRKDSKSSRGCQTVPGSGC
ncbi:putative methyl-CpG-binding domain protein 5 isoform X3 [Penaeus vannamei]|uniref:Putative methyl-CpG-binding domain protein 5 isoform X3 n=1 Tax=Penaeus vannamei TaxID=6689 RepID=A0A423SH83_PENVA|nr:putative methyl-CpG-binding domain protein 5 isoform X3 [Penaeus vannamei]